MVVELLVGWHALSLISRTGVLELTETVTTSHKVSQRLALRNQRCCPSVGCDSTRPRCSALGPLVPAVLRTPTEPPRTHEGSAPCEPEARSCATPPDPTRSSSS